MNKPRLSWLTFLELTLVLFLIELIIFDVFDLIHFIDLF
jgi:hypothetical protein